MNRLSKNFFSVRLRVSIFVAVFIIFLMWISFFIEHSLSLNLYRYGLYPRSMDGLIGILTAPLIHANLKHLYSNSFSLFFLIIFLFYFHPSRAWNVIISSWVITYLLLWIIGREAYHIGASGIVYALTSFHFFYGIASKNKSLIAISLIIVFIYGSSIWGMFPTFAYDVSWEAHLSGYITGFILALMQPKLPDDTSTKVSSGKEIFYYTVDMNIDIKYQEER